MTNRMLLHACVCALWVIAASPLLGKEPARDRRAFAAAMSKVQEHMPAAQALSLVGKPDDIMTSDESECSPAGSREIWCYGTRCHADFPILGRIGIDEKQQVMWLSGQGLAPSEGLFTETELREIFEAFCVLPVVNENDYNPRPVIQAVNLLQPLGKASRCLRSTNSCGFRMKMSTFMPARGCFSFCGCCSMCRPKRQSFRATTSCCRQDLCPR